MIKLTLHPESHPQLYTFNTKRVVVIGALNSTEADLPLSESDIQPTHVKIIEEKDKFFIINVANDPFVSLNGLPFGKKILHHHDILQIGKTLIRFEGNLTENISDEHLKESHLLNSDLEEGLDRLLEKHLNVDEWKEDDLDLDSLIQEVEQLDFIDEKIEISESQETKTLSKNVEKIESSLAPLSSVGKSNQEKQYVVDIEDDEEPPKQDKKDEIPQSNELPKNVRFIVTISLTTFFLLLMALGIAYFNISSKIELEEINASKGAADVAMALTYAQVNHIKPQKQNWSDSEFLKNNLAAVLTSDYLSLSNIDSQGSFINCPYILRIYPSQDFSQFLVIALPAPSFLQWLFPRNAIIIDSKAMEMRQIQDLRALNRLLVNQNTFDKTIAEEVSNLVKHGTLIPLVDLVQKTADQGFSPPENLSKKFPGAENFIYNAPRYYHFSEAFMQKAVNVMKTPASGGNEITKLQNEILLMANLPHLVLYSSQGSELIEEALKAIETFSPQYKFLTAGLDFDDNGEFSLSRLYEQKSKILHFEDEDHEIAMAQESEQSEEKNDFIHPLTMQFKALAFNREQALKETSIQIIALINGQTHEYQENFIENFQTLFQKYEQIDTEQQNIILKELNVLFKENSSKPLSEIIPYTKSAGLENLVKAALKIRPDDTTKTQSNSEKIEEIMQLIRDSKSFHTLESHVEQAAALINLKHIPDLDKVLILQNLMRSNVLQKLSEFLLYPETQLANDEFKPENRKILEHILKTAWIMEAEEIEFYLYEFDLHVLTSNLFEMVHENEGHEIQLPPQESVLN